MPGPIIVYGSIHILPYTSQGLMLDKLSAGISLPFYLWEYGLIQSVNCANLSDLVRGVARRQFFSGSDAALSQEIPT